MNLSYFAWKLSQGYIYSLVNLSNFAWKWHKARALWTDQILPENYHKALWTYQILPENFRELIKFSLKMFTTWTDQILPEIDTIVLWTCHILPTNYHKTIALWTYQIWPENVHKAIENFTWKRPKVNSSKIAWKLLTYQFLPESDKRISLVN